MKVFTPVIFLILASLILTLYLLLSPVSLSPPTDPLRDKGIFGKYGCVIISGASGFEERQASIQEQTAQQATTINGVTEAYILNGEKPFWSFKKSDKTLVSLQNLLVYGVSGDYTSENGEYSISSINNVTAEYKSQKFSVRNANQSEKGINCQKINGTTQCKFHDRVVASFTNPVNVDFVFRDNDEYFDANTASAFYHIEKSKRWIDKANSSVISNFNQISTNVKITCNAVYYRLSKSIVFGKEHKSSTNPNDACPNAAYASIVRHEYGHAILDNVYPYSTSIPSFEYYSYHEGVADSFSTLTGKTECMGPEFFGPNAGCLRNVSHLRVWPCTQCNSSHEKGLILSGSFWELYNDFRETYGENEADKMIQEIFVYFITNNKYGLHPNATAVVIEADEYYYNGTNYDKIRTAFERHGLWN